MDRSTALKIVKEQLNEKRYEHTIRVTDTAVALAKRYGADLKKTELAGALHDYAKYRSLDEMRHIIQYDEYINTDFLDYGEALWHAPAGAHLVHTEAGIDDADILQAIAYHTTGRAEMSQLEKVIFLADYIEPGRDFPGVDDVRERAQSSLESAIAMALRNTIQFLLEKEQKVYPLTMKAYNAYVGQMNA